MEALHIGQIAIGSVAMFLFPGYAWVVLWRNWLDYDFVESLCLATGLSLAVIPLSLYLFTLFGVRQNTQTVVILIGISGAISIWDWVRRARATVGRSPKDTGVANDATWLIYLNLALVFLFVLIGRLWSVRALDFPLWTDSYAHTLITQLIADSGTVLTTYEPYANIDRFTYHFGFHSVAAWYHWLTGLSVPRSVVLAGQVINALVVPTTYVFVARLFRDRRAGLFAAIAVGLLSHMPAQYVNWARYTQLSGQMVLPVALVFFLEVVVPAPRRRGYIVLASLTFAGLFLVHYRVFVFALLFAGLVFVAALYDARGKRGHWQPILGQTSLVGASVLFLMIPWLLRLMSGFGREFAQEVIQGYAKESHGEYFLLVPKSVVDYSAPRFMAVLASVGLVWGAVRVNRAVLILALWVALLFAAANTHLLGITPIFPSLVVIIMLYLPIAALNGYLFSQLVELMIRTQFGFLLRRPVVSLLFTVVVILLGVRGVRANVDLVDLETGFVRPADLTAMQWIKQNVASDALFYVANTFWTPKVAHGLDAGYWIPLLTLRQTVMPPQKYASDGTSEYTNFINERLRAISAQSELPTLWETMRRYGITHVYIGKRPTDLDAQLFLSNSAYFTPLYSHEGVWIFSLVEPSEVDK